MLRVGGVPPQECKCGRSALQRELERVVSGNCTRERLMPLTVRANVQNNDGSGNVAVRRVFCAVKGLQVLRRAWSEQVPNRIESGWCLSL